MTNSRARRLLTTLVVSTVGLTACGSDDPPAADTTADPVADASSEPQVVRLAATDYAYGGVPDRVSSGTALELVNASDVEVHELVAVRLPGDEVRSVEELVRLPEDELGSLLGPVATVIVAPPGESGFPVEGDGVLNEPGRYVLLCLIPTGVDPAEYLAAAAEAEGGPPEVDGGPPHIVEGIYAELLVE